MYVCYANMYIIILIKPFGKFKLKTIFSHYEKIRIFSSPRKGQNLLKFMQSVSLPYGLLEHLIFFGTF